MKSNANNSLTIWWPTPDSLPLRLRCVSPVTVEVCFLPRVVFQVKQTAVKIQLLTDIHCLCPVFIGHAVYQHTLYVMMTVEYLKWNWCFDNSSFTVLNSMFEYTSWVQSMVGWATCTYRSCATWPLLCICIEWGHTKYQINYIIYIYDYASINQPYAVKE